MIVYKLIYVKHISIHMMSPKEQMVQYANHITKKTLMGIFPW